MASLACFVPVALILQMALLKTPSSLRIPPPGLPVLYIVGDLPLFTSGGSGVEVPLEQVLVGIPSSVGL